MSCYFQMGHNTENLVGAEGLTDYKGIILSPVNRAPNELQRHLSEFREKGTFDIVLDPQLYYPQSERGKLRQHPHFPNDFDTADLGNREWWRRQAVLLSDYSQQLAVTAVASPACVPKVWSQEYYSLSADVADKTMTSLEDSGIRVLTTVLADSKDLTGKTKASEIATILSATPTDGYYVVFVSPVEPRREMADENEVFGMMSLIRELCSTGQPVMVSHTSSDMVLYKVAGATDCATGKFFNLRRFTESRYEEPDAGGGQLPYWFEQGLMAFLRQADILRLKKSKHSSILGTSHSGNIWSRRILEHLESRPEEPWLGLSWRQYLNWFVNAENELSTNPDHVRQWLRDAEQRWRKVEDDDVLFDEARNDGGWIRPWRQALVRFTKGEV
jgi:hypothetical protein